MYTHYYHGYKQTHSPCNPIHKLYKITRFITGVWPIIMYYNPFEI